MKVIVKRMSDATYFTRWLTGAPCFGGTRDEAYRFESREEYDQALARSPGLAGDIEEVSQ